MAEEQTGVRTRSQGTCGADPEPQRAEAAGAVPAASAPTNVPPGTAAESLIRGGHEPNFTLAPETDDGRGIR